MLRIESWKTSIQINHEVTQTMPSEQEIRLAFQRLISPLKVADEDFKFHQNLLVSQTFGTQKISDEDVLKYFQQTEEKIHSMDTRKQLKFPDRSPPSKTMRLIRRTMSRNLRERGILDPSRLPHLRLDSSRRDHHKRREKRERENHLKGNHNPRRRPHQRLLLPLLLIHLHLKQGEVTIPIEQKRGHQAPLRNSVCHIPYHRGV